MGARDNDPISNFRHSPGLHNVGSYQVAGRPYITGSVALATEGEDKISFPHVAKSVTVINTSTDNVELRMHFSSKTTNAAVLTKYHYVSLPSYKDSVTFNVKCKEVYVSNPDGSDKGSYTVFAELTGIPAERMYELSGSGINEDLA